MRQVVGTKEAAEVREREGLAGYRHELAITDAERCDLRLEFGAGGGTVRRHRILDRAVVVVTRPGREHADLRAQLEQFVRERDAHVPRRAPHRLSLTDQVLV